MLGPSTSVAHPEVMELAESGASWPAIFAGAVASAAVSFVVLAFGVGLGLSVVSPWGNNGVSFTTFKVGTGLFLIVIAMLSSSIGGYVAGRLRTKWSGVHADEVYFRDTAQGFLSWALATVVGLVLLAGPASGLLGSATSGLSAGAAPQSARGCDGQCDDPNQRGHDAR